MAKYLEIIGDNNKVIIDDQNARLHLTRSYSLSHFGTIRSLEPYTDLISDNYWLIAKILVYEIQLNSNEVFFSIRALASNENVGFARCAVSAKKSYLYCYINKQGKNSFSASNFIIDFYGIDTSYTEHGSGLQIFDATGNNVVLGPLACVGGDFLPENNGLRAGNLYVGGNVTGNMSLDSNAYFDGNVANKDGGVFDIKGSVTLNGKLSPSERKKRAKGLFIYSFIYKNY